MPKDNEVDEKVKPVAWIVTNGGESCEPWLEYEQSEVDALPSACIADPLYSAATVAELRAKADAAERRVGELEAAIHALQQAESEVRIHEAMNPRSRNYRLPVYVALRAARERMKSLTGADPT